MCRHESCQTCAIFYKHVKVSWERRDRKERSSAPPNNDRVFPGFVLAQAGQIDFSPFKLMLFESMPIGAVDRLIGKKIIWIMFSPFQAINAGALCSRTRTRTYFSICNEIFSN